ncbi:MAG: hypothetical protein CMJ18_27065 [Phycisphaeraceae bacterium]|nr:hypothetical protein [Phycisphaeraceae bacterium]
MASGNLRKVFAALALLAVAAACAWWLKPSRAIIRNVLLISIDTCRADHLSCYGYKDATTPNIDALAQSGILFENAISPVPLTLPAHSSMLTGTLPPYHGVHGNTGYRLDDSIACLPETLGVAGFATAAAVGAFVLDSRFGLEQGFEAYDDTFEDTLAGNLIVQRRGGETTDRALEWIERNKDERFFYFLHYYDPHHNYEAPEPFASRFASHPYAGEIAYTDDCIGRVIRKLKELDLYESTLIIVVGDHGEMLGEHGEHDHGYFIYQGAVRIPLIFRLPGGETPMRIPSLVGLVDIVPTVCSLLDVAPPPEVHGRDLSVYWKQGDARQPDRTMYCESFYPTSYGANPLVGVVSDRFKFIRTTRPELYDLVEDAAESDNLVPTEPGRAKTLSDELDAILERTLRDDSQQSKVAPDQDDVQRLQSLGYTGGHSFNDTFDFDPDKEDPKDNLGFHLLTQKVNLFLNAKDFDRARIHAAEMIRQKPDHVSGHKKMAIGLAEVEDYAQAIQFADKAARLDPGDALNFAFLGRLYDTVGETDRAIESYRQSLAIDPDNAAAHHELGRIHMIRKEFARAAECFRNVVRIQPDASRALSDLGNACRAQGKLDEAISHYERSLAIDPTAAFVHYNLGTALTATGRPETAISHFRLAIRHAPGHTGSYQNLVWLLATDTDAPFHDPAEAVRLAQKAIERTNHRGYELAALLAIAHAAAGDFPNAVEAAERAIAIAQQANDPAPLPGLKAKLELFKARKPYIPGPR